MATLASQTPQTPHGGSPSSGDPFIYPHPNPSPRSPLPLPSHHPCPARPTASRTLTFSLTGTLALYQGWGSGGSGGGSRSRRPAQAKPVSRSPLAAGPASGTPPSQPPAKRARVQAAASPAGALQTLGLGMSASRSHLQPPHHADPAGMGMVTAMASAVVAAMHDKLSHGPVAAASGPSATENGLALQCALSNLN